MRTSIVVIFSVFAAVSSTSVSAQEWPAVPFGREQARTRILDACVIEQARAAGPEAVVAPKCSCYAQGLSRQMTDEDIAEYGRSSRIPQRLRPVAETIYGRC